MILSLILWLTLGWLPILIYFMHRNETRFKKNLVVEVTLPFQARTDLEVQAMLKRFSRRSLLINLVLFLSTIPLFLIRGTNLLLSLWMTWMLLAILLPQIPYIRTNLALKRLKEARGWRKARDQVQTLDLSALPATRWLSPWAFVPAVALSFLPLLWDGEMLPLYLTLGLTTLGFWFGYRYLYRNKSEMVDQNVQLTRALTQIRRHNWGMVWLTSAYGCAALSLLFALCKTLPLIQLAGSLLITFLIGLVALRVEFRTRRIQARLTRESGKSWYVDDDDHWLGGVVYYNPNDSRLLVNSRVGVNTTFNLARTSGKIGAALIALMMLALPFTGVFLNALEHQPLRLELTAQQLIAHRGSKQEVLARQDIAEVQLLQELPRHMTRKWGNAMDHLLSGAFSIQELGRVQLSLDPSCAPFLLVRLKDGSHYLFGSRQPGEVEAIFGQLQ